MKYIKCFLLVVLGIYICGCSATYNLEIDEKVIKEELLINGNYLELPSEKVDYIYYDLSIDNDNPLLDGDESSGSDLNDGITIYNRSVDKKGNNYFVKYKYDKFDKDSFGKSSIVNSSFSSFGFIEDEEGLYLFANNPFIFNEYEQLNNITINVKTNYSVLDSNADFVNGNVYSWIISRNDLKNIYLKMNNKKLNINGEEISIVDQKDNSDFNNNSNYTFYLIIGGILIYLGVLFFIVKKK